MSGAHGHGHDDHGGGNKKIGLLIAVLALVLAVAETLGNGAQTSALNANIQAANLWSFFQAKTIRMTTLRTAAEQAELDLPQVAGNPSAKEAYEKRIDTWKKTAARYESEPDTGEGRKELMARAKETEAKRDRALSAYHNFELGSGAVQIAIVLASAAIITGLTALVWVAGGLGILGAVFCVIGIFWPMFHLF